MHQLSSELLLNIFKRLNSLEMVLIMCVCKDWLEIIDDNKSLWRRLVLPQRKNGWGISAVELFDRKSNSSLKEVEMQVNLNRRESKRFMDLLEASKSTLQTLHLLRSNFRNKPVLSDLCWKLPSITSFRMIDFESNVFSNLIEKKTPKGEGKRFKVLGVLTTKSLEEAFSKDPHRFDHLASLRIDEAIKTLPLIKVLKKCSQTLKHLGIHLSNERQSQSFAAVNLILLEVLELKYRITRFPSWLKLPSSCTLINHTNTILSGLPRIERICMPGLSGKVQRLTTTYPHLVELRIMKTQADLLTTRHCDKFIAMLLQRKINVNTGMEIEGVRMIHLKRLVFPFEFLSQSQLLQLRDLVESVIDLKSVERPIEVEV